MHLTTGILIYQIIIFAIVYASGYWSRPARFITLVIVILWTIIQVRLFPLMILQGITIYAAYTLSKKKRR